MEIKRVENQSEWNDFLRALTPHSFLQTWEWGEFNRGLGSEVFRFGLYEGGLIGVSMAFLIKARRGSFLFVPHGPLLKKFNPGHLAVFLENLKALAGERRAAFVRVSPLLLDDVRNRALFLKLGFRQAPMHMHAERMWLLDVRPSEEELLFGMRKNCRAAVRKAEKSGVEVRISGDPADLAHFMKLYEETARRQHFVPFSKDYIRREFEVFQKTGSAAIFLGRHGGEVRSAALVIFAASEAFYHQGASVMGDPVPVSHAVQWAAIKEAKRRNCTHYNFWGVSRESDSNHPWAGLSYFKRGFGGFEQNYLHAQDLPLTLAYWPAFLLESIRRIKRHF